MIRILVVLLLAASASTLAQPLPTPEAVRDYGNQVVMAIGKGNLNDAWTMMKSNTTIPPSRIDDFASGYRSQIDQTIKYFGPSIGMELISGESLLRLTYLIKYEVTGVSWFLTFYKGRDNWVLTDFNYDLNMNSIFYD